MSLKHSSDLELLEFISFCFLQLSRLFIYQQPALQVSFGVLGASLALLAVNTVVVFWLMADIAVIPAISGAKPGCHILSDGCRGNGVTGVEQSLQTIHLLDKKNRRYSDWCIGTLKWNPSYLTRTDLPCIMNNRLDQHEVEFHKDRKVQAIRKQVKKKQMKMCNTRNVTSSLNITWINCQKYRDADVLKQNGQLFKHVPVVNKICSYSFLFDRFWCSNRSNRNIQCLPIITNNEDNSDEHIRLGNTRTLVTDRLTQAQPSSEVIDNDGPTIDLNLHRRRPASSSYSDSLTSLLAASSGFRSLTVYDDDDDERGAHSLTHVERHGSNFHSGLSSNTGLRAISSSGYQSTGHRDSILNSQSLSLRIQVDRQISEEITEPSVSCSHQEIPQPFEYISNSNSSIQSTGEYSCEYAQGLVVSPTSAVCTLSGLVDRSSVSHDENDGVVNLHTSVDTIEKNNLKSLRNSDETYHQSSIATIAPFERNNQLPQNSSCANLEQNTASITHQECVTDANMTSSLYQNNAFFNPFTKFKEKQKISSNSSALNASRERVHDSLTLPPDVNNEPSYRIRNGFGIDAQNIHISQLEDIPGQHDIIVQETISAYSAAENSDDSLIEDADLFGEGTPQFQKDYSREKDDSNPG